MKPQPSGPSLNQSTEAMSSSQNTSNSLLQQAASDICRNQSLRAREILASTNTPAALFPLLQQGSLPYTVGNAFGTFPQQNPGQPLDFTAFFNGLVGMSQAAMPFQFQQILAAQSAVAGNSSNSLLGQASQNGSTPALNLPHAALASFNNAGLQSLANGGSQTRTTPASQNVQGTMSNGASACGNHAQTTEGNKVSSASGNAPSPTANGKDYSLPSGAKAPIIVYMECDEESLSDYQCLLRKQIELFEATPDDVQWNAQGRNKAIVLGQVGIRCRYCSQLPTWSRARGAVYYSATLDGLYQAAQNMAKNHLCRFCRLIPEDMKWKLVNLRDCKRRAAGGKKYWAEGARVLGVVQSSDGLRFEKSNSSAASDK